MPDDKATPKKDTQADLDEAQASLESNVAQLKELVMDKVETVERPFQWLHDNIGPVLIGVGAAIVLMSIARRND